MYYGMGKYNVIKTEFSLIWVIESDPVKKYQVFEVKPMSTMSTFRSPMPKVCTPLKRVGVKYCGRFVWSVAISRYI